MSTVISIHLYRDCAELLRLSPSHPCRFASREIRPSAYSSYHAADVRGAARAPTADDGIANLWYVGLARARRNIIYGADSAAQRLRCRSHVLPSGVKEHADLKTRSVQDWLARQVRVNGAIEACACADISHNFKHSNLD